MGMFFSGNQIATSQKNSVNLLAGFVSIQKTIGGGGFKYLLFSPLLGKIPILTNIIQLHGLKPPTRKNTRNPRNPDLLKFAICIYIYLQKLIFYITHEYIYLYFNCVYIYIYRYMFIFIIHRYPLNKVGFSIDGYCQPFFQ